MIKAVNIFKSYNGEQCLKGINLQINRGEFVSVVGESGSGKTTLLEVLAGVREPDEGAVHIDGVNVFELSPNQTAEFRRTKIGVVYQNFALVSTLNGGDNIRLPLVLVGVEKTLADQKIEEIAKLFKIEGCLNKFPEQMSGGQQQRVALARALIYTPKVLFLDEPTGSLDSENTLNVLSSLKKINREMGVTIFQITHSDRAAEFSDRVIRIKDGVIE